MSGVEQIVKGSAVGSLEGGITLWRCVVSGVMSEKVREVGCQVCRDKNRIGGICVSRVM